MLKFPVLTLPLSFFASVTFWLFLQMPKVTPKLGSEFPAHEQENWGSRLNSQLSLPELLPLTRSLYTRTRSSPEAALKSLIPDPVQYVSANGNDRNDGLSPETPKLTWQAAYNALPSSGGKIHLSTAYTSFSTPITLTVSGKPVTVQGEGPQITILNYTPTTASTALAIDVTPASSTTPYAPYVILRDFTLINNNCSTNGGCRSSAVGIAMGSTNGGAQRAEFSDIEVAGFGVGFYNSNDTSWGQTFRNLTFTHNTTGIVLGTTLENLQFIGGAWITNGTALTNAGADITVLGVSCDSNTGGSLGIACYSGTSSSTSTWIGDHFENLNCGTQGCVHYMNTVGQATIIGGEALDDTLGGANRDYWFKVANGDIEGLTISSVSETVTNLVFISTAAKMSFQNASPSTLSPCPTFLTSYICSVWGNGVAPYISTPGLRTNLQSKSVAYTLSASDSWVNVTGTTTITVPHALAGQRWDVFNSGSGTVTLKPDGGNICVAGSCAATKTVPVNTGYSIICDGTNCFAH
jgi:hypothetical protein